MVRNYMNIPVGQHVLLSQKEYRELGAKIYEGYHCFFPAAYRGTG